MLKPEFFTALKNYTDQKPIESLWREIEKQYSTSGRHYHTLGHLDNLVLELLPHQSKFKHWSTVIMAIAYHDLSYNVLKQNNEEKSAQLAVERLTNTTFPHEQIERCKQLILATKKHEPADEETNLFTDADLSILGADVETYKTYAQQIRKEYFIYPNLVYNSGRKKVLVHFLSMPRIFKSEVFSDKYEKQARVNLENELKTLS